MPNSKWTKTIMIIKLSCEGNMFFLLLSWFMPISIIHESFSVGFNFDDFVLDDGIYFLNEGFGGVVSPLSIFEGHLIQTHYFQRQIRNRLEHVLA